MARTIADINDDIIVAVQTDSTLSGLTSTSRTAIWRLWSYIVASAIWVLETLFDAHLVEVNDALALLKPHTTRWYSAKSKLFQYGSQLIEGSDAYDNTNISSGTQEQREVVKQAAAVEVNGQLVIKIAGYDNSNVAQLTKITTPQYNAFVGYINEVKDAGVPIEVVNFDGDRLQLSINVYYDGQILGANGARLDGDNDAPLQMAINAFLTNMPFDGRFVRAKLIDALQLVDGVKTVEMVSALGRKYDVTTWTVIDAYYSPYAGWLKIYDEQTDLVLNFIQY